MFAARGEREHDGASVPGPAVPGGRGHRAHHEDTQDPHTQPAHLRALQPAQVPSQGTTSRLAHQALYASSI